MKLLRSLAWLLVALLLSSSTVTAQEDAAAVEPVQRRLFSFWSLLFMLGRCL